MEMLRKILNEEGIGSFFKGVIPSLFLTINPVIQFTIYEYMRNSIINYKGGLSSLNIIYISFVSKLITTLITYPVLTVKTLFQANDKKTNAEIFVILNEMLKNEGMSGFYKGMDKFNIGIGAKIFQTLTNNILVMLSYEKIQILIRNILLNFLFRPKKKLIFSNF
jgi:adenine nucleotide transporter 17